MKLASKLLEILQRKQCEILPSETQAYLATQVIKTEV